MDRVASRALLGRRLARASLHDDGRGPQEQAFLELCVETSTPARIRRCYCPAAFFNRLPVTHSFQLVENPSYRTWYVRPCTESTRPG